MYRSLKVSATASSASVLFSQFYFLEISVASQRMTLPFKKIKIFVKSCQTLLPGYDDAIKINTVVGKKKDSISTEDETKGISTRPTRSGPSGDYQITCVGLAIISAS